MSIDPDSEMQKDIWAVSPEHIVLTAPNTGIVVLFLHRKRKVDYCNFTIIAFDQCKASILAYNIDVADIDDVDVKEQGFVLISI